jgi:hypothetical protein
MGMTHPETALFSRPPPTTVMSASLARLAQEGHEAREREASSASDHCMVQDVKVKAYRANVSDTEES